MRYANKLIKGDDLLKKDTTLPLIATCISTYLSTENYIQITYNNVDNESIVIHNIFKDSCIVIYNKDTHHQHNIDLSNNKIKKIYFTGLNDYVEIEDYMDFSDIGELTDDELMYITMKYNL